MEKNKGFSFYENFWTSIENLPLEQQKDVCYAIAKYGITGELIDMETSPIAFAMTTAFKPSLDKSIEIFNNQSEKGSKGGRPKKINDDEFRQLLIDNPQLTAQEIADHFGVSISGVQKNPIWKTRKNLSITDIKLMDF